MTISNELLQRISESPIGNSDTPSTPEDNFLHFLAKQMASEFLSLREKMQFKSAKNNPPKTQDIYEVIADGFYSLAIFYKDSNEWVYRGEVLEVTHWRHLPNPPEVENPSELVWKPEANNG